MVNTIRTSNIEDYFFVIFYCLVFLFGTMGIIMVLSSTDVDQKKRRRKKGKNW